MNRWLTTMMVMLVALSLGLTGCPQGPAVPDRIAITPATATIAMPGGTQQLTVTGTTGTMTAPVTMGLTWSSSNAMVATVSNAGLVTGVASGMATITASLARSGMTALTATSVITVGGMGMITAIQVTGGSNVAVGGTTNFTATAMLSDGMTRDVTSTATWASSMTSIATVNAMGQATGVAAGMTTISATVGTVMGSAPLTVASAVDTLVSIALNPVTANLVVGSTMPTTISATGTFSNGMSRPVNDDMMIMWTSSAPTVAAVMGTPTGGAVTAGMMEGTAMVTARIGSVTSSPAIITVAPDGRATGLTISPTNPMAAAGTNVTFTASAMFGAMMSRDVTATAMFTSSNTMVAAPVMGMPNVFRCASMGMSTITATFTSTMGGMPVTAMTTLNCSSATLMRITLEPASGIVPVGSTLAFRANGVFSDSSSSEITSMVSWTSSSTMNATVNAMGVVTGVATGSTNIVATLAGVMSTPAPVVVTDPMLRTLTVEPPNPTVAIGAGQQLRAQATFSDMSTADVTNQATWTSSAPTTATVSSAGNVVGVARGMANVTAMFRGMSGMSVVTVSGGIPMALDVTPAAPSPLPRGTTLDFTATLRLTDGTMQDVTRDANLTWTSGTTATATIDNSATMTKGRVAAVAMGNTIITARYMPMGGMPITSAPVNVSVVDATVRSISITPPMASVAPGFTARFQATATLTDMTTRDVSTDPLLTWTTSAAATATIDNLGSTKGLARGVAAGMATITATYGAGMMAPTATAMLTVTNVTLASITIMPATATVMTGGSFQYRAQGNFSDGTTADITEDVSWAVGGLPAPAPAWMAANGQISDLPGTKGRFTAGTTPVSVANGLNQVTATRLNAMGAVVASDRASVNIVGMLNLTALAIQYNGAAPPANFAVPGGTTIGLRAIATFSDGVNNDVRDVTNDMGTQWNTSNMAVATVSNAAGMKGQVTSAAAAAAAANAQITVSLSGFTSTAVTVIVPPTTCVISSINITTASTVAPINATPQTSSTPNVARPSINQVVNDLGRGATRQLYAWGIFTGAGCAAAAPLNITEASTISWTSTAPTTAAVSGAAGTRGLVSIPNNAPITAPGGTGADISARLGTVEALFQVRVTNACIRSVTLTQLGGTRAFPVGVAQTWIAQAMLQDGSTIRTSDGSLPASFISFTASLMGTTQILQRRDVVPPTPATNLFLPGTFEGAAAGTSTVTGTITANRCLDMMGAPLTVTATAMATVNAATLSSVAITPATAMIAPGANANFTAAGTYSDMTTFDVTGLASWNSSDANLTFGTPQLGRSAQQLNVNAAATAGTTRVITANFRGQAGMANIMITGATPGTINSIVTTATTCRLGAGANSGVLAAAAWPVGSDIPLTVAGTNSAGMALTYVNSALTFTVSNPTVATVSAAGVLSFNTAGSTTVTASVTGASPAISFTSPMMTAQAATLTAIQIRPRDPSGNMPLYTIFRGTTLQFSTVGSFMGFNAATPLAAGGCPIANSRGVMWTALPAAQAGWSIDAATGLATATAATTPGNVTVTARYTPMGAMTALMDSSNGTIVGSCINGVEIAAAATTIAADENTILTPSTVNSDGSRTPITTNANLTWTTTNALVANAVSNANGTARIVPATPAMAGTTTINLSANLTGLCAGRTAPLLASQMITVSSATLRTITVTCTRPNGLGTAGVGNGAQLPAGLAITCSARGNFSDGSSNVLAAGAATWAATGSGTVTTAGVVTTGPATGTIIVTATAAGGISGVITFDVSTAVLSAIRVIPLNAVGIVPPLAAPNDDDLPVGLRVRYQALADYMTAGGGMQTFDVTELANWTTTATAQYTLNNMAGSKGIVTAAAVGTSAPLTATYGGMMGSRGITVSTRVLRMMNPILTQVRNAANAFVDDLLGAGNAVPAGLTREIRVAGFFCAPAVNCGNAYDLTEQAALSVVNPAVAAIETINGRPNARAVAAGVTQIRGVYTMQQDDSNYEVSGACVNAIAITPASVQAAITTPANQSSFHTYTVTATRSDGSTVAATDPANGLTAGLSFNLTGAPGTWPVPGTGNNFTVQYPVVGTGMMTARLTTGLCAGTPGGAVTSPAASIVATAATLTGVTVAPLATTSMTRTTGQFLDYRATGSYMLTTGGTITANVTGGVTLWTSGNGFISANSGNVTNLRARFEPFFGSMGTTGTTFVRARLGMQEGSAPITVTGQAPTGIFVQFFQWRQPAAAPNDCLTNTFVGAPPPAAPPSFDGPVGGFRGRIRVMATYTPAAPATDVTSQVTLTADSAVLSVASDGTVTTPMTVGATTTTTITATPTFPGVMPATASFTLLPGPLNNVVIGSRAAGATGPATIQVALGNNLQTYATGNFGAGAGATFCITPNLTWTTGTSATATVDNTGLITPVAAGNAVITATAVGGRNDTVNVTVSAATPMSIALQPAALSVQTNTDGQLRAILTLSNGATQDVTTSNQINYWLSPTTAPGNTYTQATRFGDAVLQIGNDGSVTGVTAGARNVSACYGPGFVANGAGCTPVANVTVRSTPATITVTP